MYYMYVRDKQALYPQTVNWRQMHYTANRKYSYSSTSLEASDILSSPLLVDEFSIRSKSRWHLLIAVGTLNEAMMSHTRCQVLHEVPVVYDIIGLPVVGV